MPGDYIGYCTHSIRGEPRSSWIGGDKTGNDRWYDIFVPMADKIYGRHLEQLQKEGEA